MTLNTVERADAPFDIWAEIFSLLDPLDIVRLRKVSRCFRDITLGKTIWIKILRRLCRNLKTTLPFPLLPTTTTAEIENAALASFRFAARLNNAGDSKALKPARTRVLTAKHGNSGNHVTNLYGVHFSHVSLVPGGRFLITILSSVYIQIWDLSDPSHGLDQPIGYLRAGPGCRYTSINSAVLDSTLDGRTTIVMILTGDDFVDLGFTVCEIHTINVSDRDGRLEFQGKIRLPVVKDDNSYQFQPEYDYLLINSATTVTVLDYRKKTFARVWTGQVLDDDIQADVFVCTGKNYISRWDSTIRRLLFHKLPPFLPFSEYGIEKHTTLARPSRCSIDDPRPPHIMVVYSAWDEYERCSIMDILDTIPQELTSSSEFTDDMRGRVVKISSYRVIPPPDPTHITNPPDVLHPTLTLGAVYEEHIATIDFMDYLGLRTFTMPPGPTRNGFFLWADRDNIFLKSLKPSNPNANPTHTIWKRRPGDQIDNFESLSFCSFSARFCILQKSYDPVEIDASEIRILDFA